MECLVFIKIKKPIFSAPKIAKVVGLVGKKIRRAGICSVHLVGSKKIRELNKVYRRQDRVTDVLSFGAEGMGTFKGEIKDWGDIFICQERIIQQAKTFRVSQQEEMARMLVHGLLHLVGYDHEESALAKKMFSLQEKILKEVL